MRCADSRESAGHVTVTEPEFLFSDFCARLEEEKRDNWTNYSRLMNRSEKVRERGGRTCGACRGCGGSLRLTNVSIIRDTSQKVYN